MARSTAVETHQESDWWLAPYAPISLSPYASDGARGSFGWFDRGRLVERGARATKEHKKMRRDDETRWRPPVAV